MSELTISEVARQVGLQASAIRYYERIGLLPPAPRISGQRRGGTGTGKTTLLRILAEFIPEQNRIVGSRRHRSLREARFERVDETCRCRRSEGLSGERAYCQSVSGALRRHLSYRSIQRAIDAPLRPCGTGSRSWQSMHSQTLRRFARHK